MDSAGDKATYDSVSCAALTNYYKCSGFQQYKFIILQLCKSEAEISFTRLNSRCRQDGFFLEMLGDYLEAPRILYSLPLSPSSNHITPTLVLSLTSPFTDFDLLNLPLMKALVIILGSLGYPKKSSHLKVLNLITSSKSLV